MPEDKKLFRLKVRTVKTVGFVEAGDDPEAELVFFKRREAGASHPAKPREGDMPKFDKSKLDDAARAEFEKLETAAKEAEDKQTAAEEAQATAEGERDTEKTRADEAEAALPKEEGDVTKGMSDEVKAAFEKQEEKNEALQKAFDAEVEKRETDAMAIRFAKGGDLEQIGGEKRLKVLLKAKSGMDAEDWDELDTMLKAASAQILEGALLKEAGVDGEPEAGEAEVEFKAEVAKLREADPKMTEVQARAQIVKTDTALYRRVRDEQKANA